MPKIRGGGMKPGAGGECGQTAGQVKKNPTLSSGFLYIHTDRPIKSHLPLELSVSLYINEDTSTINFSRTTHQNAGNDLNPQDLCPLQY